MAIDEETCMVAHEAAVDVVPKARPCEGALATNWLPALNAMPCCHPNEVILHEDHSLAVVCSRARGP